MRLLDNDQQGQTNIFGAGQPQGQSPQGQQSQNMGSVPKTSTQGSLGSTGGGASQPSGMLGSGAVAGQQVQRNAPNPNTAKAILAPTQQQVFNNQAQLQQEIEAYKQPIIDAAKSNKVDKNTIKEAAYNPDSEAWKKTQGYLRPGETQVEAFTPKAQYNFNDMADLSAGTYGNLVQRFAPQRASTGSINLQQNLLKGDPNFQAEKASTTNMVNSFKQNLNEVSGTGPNSPQAQVRSALEQIGKNNQTEAQNYISSLLQGYKDQDLSIRNNVAAANEGIYGQASNLEQRYIADILRSRPELAPYLSPDLVDESKYVVAGSPLSPGVSYLPESDVAAFNNLRMLLGDGGPTMTAANPQQRTQSRIRENNLKQSIEQAALKAYADAQAAAEQQAAASRAAPASSPQRSSPVIVAPPNPIQETIQDPLKAVRGLGENISNVSKAIPGPTRRPDLWR